MKNTEWADTSNMVSFSQAEQLAARQSALLGSAGGLSLSPRFQGIRPVCCWCKIPVNRFTDSYDVSTRQFLFRFECHGREEIVPIDQEFIERFPNGFMGWLLDYRPFARDAEAASVMAAAAYIPRGGGIMPLAPSQPERPSPAFGEFMQKVVNDIAGKFGLPPDSVWRNSFTFVSSDEAERPVVQPRPQPKVEDFLLPARKPRIITL